MRGRMLLSAMLRTFCMFVALCLCPIGSSAQANQSPLPSTLSLSLKTMSKALASCRVSYTRVYPGASVPLLKSVVGEDDYNKDLASLGSAEKIVNGLIANPDRVTGRYLVALLSSADDFSLGVGSSRTEALRHMILDKNQDGTELLVASEALNSCQKSLFDAGDDFVGIVMDYVGAEDDVVAAKAAKR
jgi:hypothetical protein